MESPTIAVVRNEVDAGCHCDALERIVADAAETRPVDYPAGERPALEADLADDPLFEGVSPVVPVAHGDVVTEAGDGMAVIGSADYYRAFATRHCTAPLWTVQFHPEFTAALRERLEADFDWTDGEYGFEPVNAARVVENFVSLAADAIASVDESERE